MQSNNFLLEKEKLRKFAAVEHRNYFAWFVIIIFFISDSDEYFWISFFYVLRRMGWSKQKLFLLFQKSVNSISSGKYSFAEKYNSLRKYHWYISFITFDKRILLNCFQMETLNFYNRILRVAGRYFPWSRWNETYFRDLATPPTRDSDFSLLLVSGEILSSTLDPCT